MKLVSFDKLKAGMVVARPIISDTGTLLLNSGITLNERLIELIKLRGIPFLYIKDERVDVKAEPLISPEDMARATHTIKKAFEAALQNNVKRSLPFDLEDIKNLVFNIVDVILKQNDLVVHLIDIKNADSYTFQHSLQVMTISLMIGKKMNLTKSQLHNLGMGAVLHDIGKVAIPKNILNKEGPLTPDEVEILKAHPRIGFELLQDNSKVWPTAKAVVLQHHEKWNGTGYPKGLAGEEIHLYSRIAAPVNVYDALVSKRPYTKSLPPHEAYAYVRENMGVLFDPEVCKQFLDIVAPYPIGTWVRLSSGYTGLVVSVKQGMVQYPDVTVFYDENMKPLKEPVTISLAENAILSIQEVVEEPTP